MPNTTIQYSLQVQQQLSRELRAIAGDTQALSREMGALARTLQGTLDTGTQGAGRLNKELAALHTTAQRAGGVFKDVFGANLASAAVGKITGGIVDLGKASLDLVGNLESNTSALTAFAGSSDAAQKQLAQFSQFAAKTSFSQQDVVKYAVQLEGVGVAGSRVVPTLRSIADALAGVGKGADPQKLQQVSDAYLKIQTQGRAQADELLSFAEAGIPIFDILAQALGKSTGEISKMAEAGQLTAQVFDRAFDVGVQQRWQGAAARSSQTLQGIISNAGDVGTQFLTILGKAAVESSGLEQRLQGVVNYLNNPQALAAVQQLGTELGTAAGHVFDMLGWLGQILGLPPLTIPDPPDFSQAAGAVTAIGQGTALWTEAASDYSKEISSAQRQMEGLRRTEARQAADAQAAAQRLRDAATTQDRIYDDQLTRLRQQADQLDRQYQIQQNQRALARASTKLADDRLLALDLSSNAGAAAADRLPDEETALQDLRAQIRHDDDKAAVKSAEDQTTAAKLKYDRQTQDAQTAAEAARAAQKATNDAAIQGWQDQIDAYTRLQDALSKPDPRVKAVSDEYRAAYDSAFGGIKDDGTAATTDAISAMTAEYAAFYAHPAGTGVGLSTLLTNLFGTDADWQGRGTAAGSAFITGFGDGLRDSPNDTLKFLGDIARGDWAAAAKDYPLVKTVTAIPGVAEGALDKVTDAGRPTGGTVPATGPNTIGGVPVPGFLEGVYGKTQTTTAIRQRQRPVGAPLGHGSGQWIAGKSYSDGTTDWVWQDSASSEYSQFYGGGRATGGPVSAGLLYQVNEPQLGGRGEYFLPAQNGAIVPNSGRAGGNTYNLTINVSAPGRSDQDYWRSVAQTISQELAAYERVRLS